ncbi:UvrD-helicase domain-containing protein [Photobacterium carnosum]|uniref:UvrD-helicase domain-containing protein n=1 Tax=Photobacterium carnosum TaxID=2023717 RepID=UPI001E3DB928|nr:ATP-dependent helicase [Photobacterium carnosum]MCD9527567.1 AAA family ATPase [Photobacterium carnosum]
MVDFDKWVPKDGLKFDNKSSDIIKSNENIAVLAGPGAGKTEILAQKACFILETELCVWPYNILSISRKRESASNIKDRVSLRCGSVLSERFHSFTIEAFTKSIVDRFMYILPKHEQPDENYKIVFNPWDRSFPKALSFDDLTLTALKIVKASSSLMKSIRATYKYVFIDEFQDLNGHQYDFVKLLFCDTDSIVTVVGDTKQAIMKFANALPDGFLKFELDFQAKLKVIYTNFRASPELKGFIDRIGYNWWPIEFGNPSAMSVNGSLDKEDYSMLLFQDEKHEAVQLSLKIQHWINEKGIKPEEISVLFRVNTNSNYSKTISQELLKLGILSINESNVQDYLSEPVGKVLIALLSLLTRTRDVNSWESLRDTYLYCRSGDNSNYEDYELNNILEFISNNRYYNGGADKSFDELLDSVVDFMNEFFYENLRNTWPQYRQGSFMEDTFHDLLNELRDARLMSSSWAGAVDLISGVGAVRMMTIHKSKGLEFIAVILVGLEDYSYFRRDFNQKKLDEERSTIFVALSRAKSKLLISCAQNRAHYGKSKFTHITSIINDLAQCGLSKQRVEKSELLSL